MSEKQIILKNTKKAITFEKKNLSKNTMMAYTTTAKQFNQFIESNSLSIDSDSVLLFMKDVKKKFKAKTFNLKRSALRSFLSAHQDSLTKFVISDLFKNKIKAITPQPKRETVYTIEEMKVLYNKMLQKKTDIKYAHILNFSISTGLRVSEILSIRIDRDVEIKNDIAKITIQAGKRNKENQTQIKLSQYNEILNAFGSSEFLFQTRTGSKFLQADVSRTMRKKTLAYGYDFHMHLGRKIYATSIYKKTKDILLIKSLLNHKEISTSESYIQSSVIDYDLVLANSLS